MLQHFKAVARQRPWLPDHGGLVLRQRFDHDRNLRRGYADHDHLMAAARWLCAAQDSQNDGGVAGRYRLDRGWTSSYPETTGYIVPTFLALDKAFPGSGYMGRAARAVDFLLRLQLPDGGFPGMEVAQNRSEPYIFDTAQILNGLTAWHRQTKDQRIFEAGERAARFLIKAQDQDGAWRSHTYINIETTYLAHASCWLAEWGDYAGDGDALKAAERHLDWVMSHVKANGWIAKMGFDQRQHDADEAFTHTIAYTIWGMLITAALTGRDDGIAAAARAAEGMLRLTELRRHMPGVVSNFRARNNAACLTGNAQMALIWFKLHAMKPNLRFVNAALKAIDMIKAAQPMAGRNAGICGGIAGSDPIDGPYIPNALPNWAAKFFVDALMEKRVVLDALAAEPVNIGPALPSIAIDPLPPPQKRPALHAVLITTAHSRKVPAMLKAFGGDVAFDRLTVVAERKPEAPVLSRLEEKLHDTGFDWLKKRWAPPALSGFTGAEPVPDVISYCRANHIKLIETGPLDSDAAIKAVTALNADLGIHAGGPILKPDLLKAFRLGVINAHMGMIPVYRGMSAAEWPALEGGTVGCSVHVIDPGIDTGPLIARRALDISGCRSTGDLWTLVDEAQLALLADVLSSVIATGALPRLQIPPEPVAPQYFQMHPSLRRLLQRRLIVNG